MSIRRFLAAGALSAASVLAGAAAPGAPAAGGGPGFDCAKAATPVEKAICASPALAELDRDMAVQYALAAAKTPTPVTLKVQQRSFLIQRGMDDEGRPAKTINVARLTELYRIRIQQLNDEIDRARRAAAASVPPAALKTRCAVVAVTDCKVEEAGPVPGSEPYGGLFYQLQGPATDDGWTRGVVVLRADGGVLRPVLWNFEGDIPAAPSVARTPDGPLLVVPAEGGGTGHHNAELVFRPVKSGWRDLDIDAWRGDFDKGLPEEVGVWKGVGYEWETLRVVTALWKSSDANCCPTGGMAEARLTVRGDQLALKSMSVDRTPPKDE